MFNLLTSDPSNLDYLRIGILILVLLLIRIYLPKVGTRKDSNTAKKKE